MKFNPLTRLQSFSACKFLALLATFLTLSLYCQTPDSFNPGADAQLFLRNAQVLSLAVQPDGRILVGGGVALSAGRPGLILAG
jgi:hypothetical protein